MVQSSPYWVVSQNDDIDDNYSDTSQELLESSPLQQSPAVAKESSASISKWSTCCRTVLFVLSIASIVTIVIVYCWMNYGENMKQIKPAPALLPHHDVPKIAESSPPETTANPSESSPSPPAFQEFFLKTDFEDLLRTTSNSPTETISAEQIVYPDTTYGSTLRFSVRSTREGCKEGACRVEVFMFGPAIIRGLLKPDMGLTGWYESGPILLHEPGDYELIMILVPGTLFTSKSIAELISHTSITLTGFKSNPALTARRQELALNECEPVPGNGFKENALWIRKDLAVSRGLQRFLPLVPEHRIGKGLTWTIFKSPPVGLPKGVFPTTPIVLHQNYVWAPLHCNMPWVTHEEFEKRVTRSSLVNGKHVDAFFVGTSRMRDISMDMKQYLNGSTVMNPLNQFLDGDKGKPFDGDFVNQLQRNFIKFVDEHKLCTQDPDRTTIMVLSIGIAEAAAMQDEWSISGLFRERFVPHARQFLKFVRERCSTPHKIILFSEQTVFTMTKPKTVSLIPPLDKDVPDKATHLFPKIERILDQNWAISRCRSARMDTLEDIWLGLVREAGLSFVDYGAIGYPRYDDTPDGTHFTACTHHQCKGRGSTTSQTALQLYLRAVLRELGV